jgi:hypothetical protein
LQDSTSICLKILRLNNRSLRYSSYKIMNWDIDALCVENIEDQDETNGMEWNGEGRLLLRTKNTEKIKSCYQLRNTTILFPYTKLSCQNNVDESISVKYLSRKLEIYGLKSFDR